MKKTIDELTTLFNIEPNNVLAGTEDDHPRVTPEDMQGCLSVLDDGSRLESGCEECRRLVKELFAYFSHQDGESLKSIGLRFTDETELDEDPRWRRTQPEFARLLWREDNGSLPANQIAGVAFSQTEMSRRNGTSSTSCHDNGKTMCGPVEKCPTIGVVRAALRFLRSVN